MAFILRELDTVASRGGTTFHQVLDQDTLRIGRGADQDLVLKDLRVAFEHAEIRKSGDEFEFHRRGEAVVQHNGRPATGGTLNSGDTLRIGRYELSVQRAGDDLGVEYREAFDADDQTDVLRKKAQLNLNASGVSKRRMAWLLAAAVLLVTLALPLLTQVADPVYRAAKAVPMLTDSIWQSGELSTAHRSFGADCRSCHVQWFSRVSDDTCLSCHHDVAAHSQDPELQHAAGLDDIRCGRCHHEHEGPTGLILSHPRLCVDCHADPADDMPGSTLRAATDFGHDHPEFSPTIHVGEFGVDRREETVYWDDLPEQGDNSSLIFPHDRHLDSDGVETSDGQTEILECDDCHRLIQGKFAFKPVDMPRDCARCHRLDFDPADPDAELPHGDSMAAIRAIRGHFATKVLEDAEEAEFRSPAGPRGRGRSTTVPAAAERETLLQEARARAERAIDEAFSTRVCAKCHVVLEPDGPEAHWDVQGYQQRQHWYSAARFTHASHQSQGCENCHAASGSDNANDVLMPRLDDCRACHGGRKPSTQQIASDCVTCHGFHIADRPHWPANDRTASTQSDSPQQLIDDDSS